MRTHDVIEICCGKWGQWAKDQMFFFLSLSHAAYLFFFFFCPHSSHICVHIQFSLASFFAIITNGVSQIIEEEKSKFIFFFEGGRRETFFRYKKSCHHFASVKIWTHNVDLERLGIGKFMIFFTLFGAWHSLAYLIRWKMENVIKMRGTR